MKKKFIIICSLIVICLLLVIIIKQLNKKNINTVYNYLVYIESRDDDTITSGSGFVYKTYNGKNYILTNYHVVEGYFDIYVYNKNEEKIKAKLVNYDENNDIAVLTISDKLGLEAVNVGNSDNIYKGDKVFVVGNPSNIKNMGTVTNGKILDFNEFENIFDFTAIKVSAHTEFGNSGGPLLDEKGNLIGMMFLKDNKESNISYAIPINFIMDFINLNDDVDIFSLGAIMANTSNNEILNEYGIDNFNIEGVVLIKLDNNGVLSKNKFKKGDIITSFNGKVINNITDLKDELYKYKKGDNINIIYYREGVYNNIIIEF